MNSFYIYRPRGTRQAGYSDTLTGERLQTVVDDNCLNFIDNDRLASQDVIDKLTRNGRASGTIDVQDYAWTSGAIHVYAEK